MMSTSTYQRERQQRFDIADKLKAIRAAQAKPVLQAVPDIAPPLEKPMPEPFSELTPLQAKQRDGILNRLEIKRQQAAKPKPSFSWQGRGNAMVPILNGNWLIKKLLPGEGLAVMYGRPGCGKSFIASDLALHVAAGISWRGLKTVKREVSYVASEGGLSGVNRIHAWLGENFQQWPEGFRLTGISLDLRSNAKDAEALIEDVKASQPNCGLVIVDTLNRNFGGGSENDDDSMSGFVGHCAKVAQELNCLVLIIHHSGKDTTRGARGHSSLLGAVSTELEILREQGLPGQIKVTKQRDAEDGQEFGFVLKPVELGQDQDGDAVTSCVVLESIIDPQSRQPGGKNQRAVQKMFVNFLADSGIPTPNSDGFPEAGKFKCVELEGFIEFVAGKLTCMEPRKIARRSVNGLVERGILAINAGKLWFLG